MIRKWLKGTLMKLKMVLIEFLEELAKNPINEGLNIPKAIALINKLPDEKTDVMTVPQILGLVNATFIGNKALWTDENRLTIQRYIEDRILTVNQENVPRQNKHTKNL